MVADNRLLRALRQADLQWSGELVFQGASVTSAAAASPLQPLDAMNRMGIMALVATVMPNTALTSQFFNTTEEASAWATAPL